MIVVHDHENHKYLREKVVEQCADCVLSHYLNTEEVFAHKVLNIVGLVRLQTHKRDRKLNKHQDLGVNHYEEPKLGRWPCFLE